MVKTFLVKIQKLTLNSLFLYNVLLLLSLMLAHRLQLFPLPLLLRLPSGFLLLRHFLLILSEINAQLIISELTCHQ